MPHKALRTIQLAYVEGWHVIAEANRIVGYDAWDRHTLSTRCVWSREASHHFAAAYTAKVHIAVRAGSLTITREGCGSGQAKAPPLARRMSSPHELALKAAETEATKRALATFPLCAGHGPINLLSPTTASLTRGWRPALHCCKDSRRQASKAKFSAAKIGAFLLDIVI